MDLDCHTLHPLLRQARSKLPNKNWCNYSSNFSATRPSYADLLDCARSSFTSWIDTAAIAGSALPSKVTIMIGAKVPKTNTGASQQIL
jgi:hypothetical protein